MSVTVALWERLRRQNFGALARATSLPSCRETSKQLANESIATIAPLAACPGSPRRQNDVKPELRGATLQPRVKQLTYEGDQPCPSMKNEAGMSAHGFEAS